MSFDKKYLTIDEENFDVEVAASDQPVLLDFWADWCPPCHAIAPVIEELASEFEGVAKVGKVDVDQNNSLANGHGIQSIPTLLFFKNGQEVDRITGVVSKAALAEKLNALLESDAVIS